MAVRPQRVIETRATTAAATPAPGARYKWIVLSNTTLGMLMAMVNSSILLISLPAIFRGIHINPLGPGESGYLLWILLGYMVVTATLLVTFGRISDMVGRVKMYNLGFAVFTLGSILLWLTPGSGNQAATELLIFRLLQGVGGAFLFANSTALLIDAFPAEQRGLAMGINQIAAIVGSLGGLVVGLLLLAAFVWIESRVRDPMFHLELFKIRMFAAGNLSGLLSSLARGGLQFMLIIWLQGIWLPLHGVSYKDTPLWAGIYTMPMMVGFMLSGPAAGWLSDRLGARALATGGMLISTTGFLLLTLLPGDFNRGVFFALLLFMGTGMGLFAAPNTTSIMNSVPPQMRGAASGMIGTFQNAGMLVSMAVFFSVLTAGLAARLPGVMYQGLTSNGLPALLSRGISHLPPIGVLFAAFLGYNPMRSLVPGPVAAHLSPHTQVVLFGKTFFPHLIMPAFMSGLHDVFYVSAALALIAAIASLLRGERYLYGEGDGAETRRSRSAQPNGHDAAA